ncbi:MAG: winged helix-turn-helix transcriptional regulator [Chloroflexi bacterium]|nr:winged helix-turn-helix transcriptional regulator [Chloroflexota bacterium]
MLKRREWTFLTNHGRVLAYLAKHPRATAREIAQEVGVTERAIQKVIFDLDRGGYIVRHREGRGNRYTIHPELPMRHRLEREHAVGKLLLALGCDLQKLAQRARNKACDGKP